MKKICNNCGNQIPPGSSYLFNDKTLCADGYYKLKEKHNDADSKKLISSPPPHENISYALGWLCVIMPILGLFLIIRYFWNSRRRKAFQVITLLLGTYILWLMFWAASSQQSDIPTILVLIVIFIPFLIIHLLKSL